jgi:hypothetical protein
MKKIKRTTVLITLILSAAYVVLMSDVLHLCPGVNNIVCDNKIAHFANLIFPALPIFLLSLFGYFLSSKLYKTWLIFSMVWAALTVGVIVYDSGSHGGGFGVVTSGGGSDIFILLSFYFAVTVPFVLISYLVTYLRRHPIEFRLK